MNRRPWVIGAAIALAVLLVAGVAFVVRQTVYAPKTITAIFPTATAIYPGDEVRVAGVKVGKIDAIDPTGTQTKMMLSVDPDVSVPADAKAVIVAPNLISARYVQLTPAYRNGDGPTMADGAVIGIDRTAIPVEWDEVKTQLTRLATDLGPEKGVDGTSVSRFIDTAANALDGNGEKLRDTLAQLSGVGRILADGSGDIVGIIKNLQIFVTALRDSSTQIVQFQNRLATLTSVLDDSRSDLDGALKNLSVAIVEVKRFVAGSRAADQRTGPASGQRHPDPGRQQGVAGERPAHRAERIRQRLQHLQSGHRRLRRRLRAAQLLEPDPLRLRCDRCSGEHDRPGNGEAVRAVPRPRRCDC